MRSAPLDGIRALAVFAVLAYHAHYWWAVGGYLGVDVFFVLSGFLITGVLLRTHRSWRGYRDFLARRAVRLMPALLVALVGVIAIVTLVGTVEERRALWPCSGASASYLMNLPFAEDLGCSAMWHVTWSLASEQQFYLVWPLLLSVLVVRRHRALVASLALGGAGLAWQVMLRIQGRSTARLDFAPDGRSLVLLLGCALALSLRFPLRPLKGLALRGRQADVAAGVAVGILGFCFVTADVSPSLGALPAIVAAGVATAVLVAALVHAPADSLAVRVLGSRPLAYLGRISYSLYLWHEVAYRLAELLGPRGSAVAETSRWVFAVLLAAASHAWVEVPTQRWWQSRRRVPVSA